MKNWFYIFMFLICCVACNSKEDRQLNYALKAAGDNRPELEKVLDYYKEDKIKLEAARFLIKNMIYHRSFDEKIMSPENVVYELNMNRFENNDEFRLYMDSLQRKGYTIKKRVVKDIESLQADYLIENIELSFEVWRKPWARQVSFTDFCRYILPYRSLYETPSKIRKNLKDRFLPILDSLQVQSPLEASKIVHSILKKNIHFLEITPPVYPTVENIYDYGLGRCDGLALMATCVMRAVGIPVSIEYTVWTKQNSEHYWCAVFNDGAIYPFAPENEAPGNLLKNLTKPFLTPGKVYRYGFAPSKETNFTVQDNYKCFLKNPLIEDVTSEYGTKPTDIDILCDQDVSIKEVPVYLCTYNNKNWRVLAMGVRSGKNCHFNDVVGDDVFIVTDSPDGFSLRFITYPFYVDRMGRIRKLIRDDIIDIMEFGKRKDQKEIASALSIWNPLAGNFESFDYKVDSLPYLNQKVYQLPRNALFRTDIVGKNKVKVERIFFVDNSNIRIY